VLGESLKPVQKPLRLGARNFNKEDGWVYPRQKAKGEEWKWGLNEKMSG